MPQEVGMGSMAERKRAPTIQCDNAMGIVENPLVSANRATRGQSAAPASRLQEDDLTDEDGKRMILTAAAPLN
jgi:hypothetical protein